jgi:DNA topoisomerase I
MKLLIVESPSKAKTIEKYLDGAYTVRASIGHVRDLPKSNKDAIDIPAGFVPTYEISRGKERVISDLRSLAKKADEILLAPDPDREGEAIAWHIHELLVDALPKSHAPIRRVTFNEITKEAVTEALKHPRDIDANLVKAQEARRVLDRLVGYDLSGLIWKKVRYGLSAGRVQSPALRILCEHERTIRAFVPEDYWVLEAAVTTPKNEALTLTCTEEPRDKNLVDKILEVGRNRTWNVKDVTESQQKRSARAPFTTSTLQQTASSRLGYSPSRTMGIAQKLYESGHITYMRTDSTNLSAQAQAQILKHIEEKFGAQYVQANSYKTKSKNAQEAHEAIRPTHIEKKSMGLTEDQKEVYNLIWERAVSSQMTDAQIMRTKISAEISGTDFPLFTANGSRLLFPGWLAVDTTARGEDVELPKVSVGEELKLVQLEATGKQTQPPSRYTEAGLIKELESRGIGRPSTYASILRTIEERGYVEKLGRSLKPTDTGEVVSEFLEKNFMDYISDTFTAEMEDKLDDIANGDREYKKVLTEFYGPFHTDVESKESIEKLTNIAVADAKFKCPKCESGMVVKLGRGGKFLSCDRYPDCDGALTIDGTDIKQDEPVGIDPESGLPIYLLTGRFGPYVQIGETVPKPKKVKKVAKKKSAKKATKKSTKNAVVEESAEEQVAPDAAAEASVVNAHPRNGRRASVPPSIKLEDMTFEIAKKLLELPRSLGTDPATGIEIIANVGRFGPYVGMDREFRSIKKPFEPYTITLEQALTLIHTPKQLPKGTELLADLGKHPKTNKDIKILKSKSGNFIPMGMKRIYLPDNMDPKGMTLDEAIALIAGSVADKKRK